MKDNSNKKKHLEEIRKKEAFDSLDAYHDPTSWQSLNCEERELLGLLFAMRGDKQLQSGDQDANSSFDLSMKIAPGSAPVLYRKGHAFAKHENNVKYLNHAVNALQKATEIDQAYYPAWFEWACVQTRIGVLNRDLSAFQQADILFTKAHQSCQFKDLTMKADCLWKWGQSWFLYGKVSGEVADFCHAIDKFKQAAETELERPEFWNDYANALVELTYLTGQREGFHKAIGYYKKAILLATNYFEAWYNLACTYHHVFHLNPNDDDFYRAHECYERAAKIEQHHGILWLKWANLFVNYGKWQKNANFLLESLERYRQADEREANHPHILRSWGEALMLCGVYTDQLSSLKEAEKKLLKSLELHNQDPLTWYLYGTCLNELGRYFEDEEYYAKAIEKFRHALNLNDKEPLLWYGLALAHFALGELKQDRKLVELADKFCQRVVEFGGKVAPQFWSDWGVVLLKLAEMSDDVDFLESAKQKFEQAFSFFDGEDSLEPEWLFHYACILDMLGDHYEDTSYIDQALRFFQKLIESDSQNTAIHYHIALAYSHLAELKGDIQTFYQSLNHFQAAFSYDHEDEVISHDWGVTLIHLAQMIYDPNCPEESQHLYTEAEKKLVYSASLGSVQAYYNLACLYSLSKQFNLSIHYLEKAEKIGALPSFEDLMHDEWLENLRATSEFEQFLSDLNQ